MPKLVCLSGMNKGDEYNLPDGCDLSLGRSESNDICVFDKKSSRKHCKIKVQGETIILEDLSSTNGTRINNLFVTGEKQLNIGDHIRIGQTVFLVSERALASSHEPDSTSSALIRKQKKYENLLQKTAFQVTKTTTLRKLKTEKEGKETGFLSFFQREEHDN